MHFPVINFLSLLLDRGSTYQFVHILYFCNIEVHLDLMALSFLSMLLVLSTSNQSLWMNSILSSISPTFDVTKLLIPSHIKQTLRTFYHSKNQSKNYMFPYMHDYRPIKQILRKQNYAKQVEFRDSGDFTSLPNFLGIRFSNF